MKGNDEFMQKTNKLAKDFDPQVHKILFDFSYKITSF